MQCHVSYPVDAFTLSTSGRTNSVIANGLVEFRMLKETTRTTCRKGSERSRKNPLPLSLICVRPNHRPMRSTSISRLISRCNNKRCATGQSATNRSPCLYRLAVGGHLYCAFPFLVMPRPQRRLNAKLKKERWRQSKYCPPSFSNLDS